MLTGTHVRRASWTLAEQGVMSAGTFVLNVLLARAFAPADYGVFALLYGGFLTLQLFNATLVFYPFSVRLVTAPPQDQARLLRATLVLVTSLSAALSVLLVIVLSVVGQGHLVLPALAFFLAWQLQEAMRRGLLTSFRHRAAVPGNVVSCLGQALVVIALGWADALTLVSALYGLAVAVAVAGLVQAYQLSLTTGAPLMLRETASDYWRIGGFWSLGNGLLMQVRTLGLPWMLAVVAGPAAAGAYQAVNTIAGLSNPIVIGFGNIIPQVASQASLGGNRRAWYAVRPYGLLMVAAVLSFSAVVLAVPTFVLELVFGAQSPYVQLATPLRILIVGGLAFCVTETVIAYLHGVREARLAFFVNAAGALFVVAVAWPLIETAGLIGACIVAAVAQGIRLVVARQLLVRTMEGHRHSIEIGGPIALETPHRARP